MAGLKRRSTVSGEKESVSSMLFGEKKYQRLKTTNERR